MRILFVSANDPENYLDIEREQRALLKLAETGGHYLKFFPAAQIPDLKELLSGVNGSAEKYDVLHFAGHGEVKGLLLRSEFDDDEHQELTGEQLKEFLEAPPKNEDRVKLVVLNACETEDVAKAIKDVVKAVIGTNAKVKDRKARGFSNDFYDELNDGATVQQAYESATVIDNQTPYIEPLGDWKPPEEESGKTEIEGLGAFYASFYGSYIDEQIADLRRDMRLNAIVFWSLLAVAVCMWIYLLNVGEGGVFWPNLVQAVRRAFYPDEDVLSVAGIWDRVQALDSFAPVLIAFFQRRIFSHGTPRLEGLQRLKESIEKWDDLPAEEQEMVRSVMHTSLLEALKDDK